MNTSGSPIQLHKALGNQTRQKILEVLRDAGCAVPIARIAQLLNLHPNTVRSHLTYLEKAGLIELVEEHGGRRGRPGLAYRILESHDGDQASGEYRLLSIILSGILKRALKDPGSVAAEEAEQWGKEILERWKTNNPGASSIAQVVGLLDTLKFYPRLEERDTEAVISLKPCPFMDAVKENLEVVCAVHMGLIRGALEASKAEYQLEDLKPFVTPTLCTAHLRKRGSIKARV